MAKKPEKKKSTLPWMACIGVVLAIVLARVVCLFAHVDWSDDLTRTMGGLELAAAAAAAFLYVRWKKQ